MVLNIKENNHMLNKNEVDQGVETAITVFDKVRKEHDYGEGNMHQIIIDFGNIKMIQDKKRAFVAIRLTPMKWWDMVYTNRRPWKQKETEKPV